MLPSRERNSSAMKRSVGVSITALPVAGDNEDLFLVSFVDDPPPELSRVRPSESEVDASRVAQLEQELAASREDLQSAIRDLEMANEEHKAINEEAMSVNEEFQSTNEELETSKEELQSLNEELTALNSQLHETVEQQRATSDDLQNIFNSTDVATLFLDARAEHPLLHARREVAVQCHCFRRRSAACRSDAPVRGRRSPAGCTSRAGKPHAVRREVKGQRRQLVHARDAALSEQRRPSRRAGHHVCRHFRDQGRRTGN